VGGEEGVAQKRRGGGKRGGEDWGRWAGLITEAPDRRRVRCLGEASGSRIFLILAIIGSGVQRIVSLEALGLRPALIQSVFASGSPRSGRGIRADHASAQPNPLKRPSRR